MIEESSTISAIKPSLDARDRELAKILSMFIQDGTTSQNQFLFAFSIAYANKRHISQAAFLKACADSCAGNT